jgi:hypothetical protein
MKEMRKGRRLENNFYGYTLKDVEHICHGNFFQRI